MRNPFSSTSWVGIFQSRPQPSNFWSRYGHKTFRSYFGFYGLVNRYPLPWNAPKWCRNTGAQQWGDERLGTPTFDQMWDHFLIKSGITFWSEVGPLLTKVGVTFGQKLAPFCSKVGGQKVIPLNQKSIYFYIIKEVAFSRGDIDGPGYFLRHWTETKPSQKRQWFFLLKVGDFLSQSCWFFEPKLAIFWSQLWFKSGSRLIHDVEINGFWYPGSWESMSVRGWAD